MDYPLLKILFELILIIFLIVFALIKKNRRLFLASKANLINSINSFNNK